jgi:hypothetical protein
MNSVPLAACAALVAALALPAEAAPVTYTFTGTVQSDEADRGYSRFTGSFNFDTATVDGIADPSTGAYAHGAGYGMSITWDATITLSLQGSLNMLTTNDLGGADQLGVLAQMGSDSFSLSLWDVTQAFLSSDALPVQALSLADFSWNSVSWQSNDGELLGRLDSLVCAAGCAGLPPPSPVPEPSILLLAGLGVAALRVRRARQVHNARQVRA